MISEKELSKVHVKEVATVLAPFTDCTSKTKCYKEAALILLTVNMDA